MEDNHEQKVATPTEDSLAFLAGSKNGETVETVKSAGAELEVSNHPSQEEVRELVRRFIPREGLLEITQWRLTRDYNISANQAEEIALQLIEKAIQEATIDTEWADRLKNLFKDSYPKTCREFWVNGRFAQKKYKKKQVEKYLPITFSSEEFDLIKPNIALATRMAPLLVDLVDTKNDLKLIKSTPELVRFLNGEQHALPKSAIHEVAVADRPRYGDTDGWDLEPGKLPRKRITSKIQATTYNPVILDELVQDLRKTFSWPDDNDSTLAAYVGYLIQPLICYLRSGQMPGYSFQGPSKSGKGYLSSVLASIIYNRVGDATVVLKMLPTSSYELEVSLNDMRHSLYIVFDEIIHASEEQLVILNSLLTQETIYVRKFGVGFQKIENQMTFALTSVGKAFSDETEGRLAIIKLTGSRPEEIDKFHEKWKLKGPELLLAIYDRAANISLKIPSLASIADRRPGFSLVAHFVENVFGLKPDYKLQTSENETLDDLCEMYFSKNDLGEEDSEVNSEVSKIQGRKIGKRRRYSVKNFCDFLSARDGRAYRRKFVQASLTTALSYRSTRFHPTYKEEGYLFRWEKIDRRCHLTFQEEGSGSNRRHWIYIQDVTPLPTKGGDVNESQFKENMKLLESLTNQ